MTEQVEGRHRRPSNVVDLPLAASVGNGYKTCDCGEGWFRLVSRDLGTPAAVCMSQEGSITGYTGVPVCVGCGNEVTV